VRAIDGQGLATASNLILEGGAFESSGIFTRALGAGAGQVQLIGGTTSGFSANTSAGLTPVGLPLLVDLGGSGDSTGPAVVWGSAFFDPSAFLLNDVSANTQLEFQNAIDLDNTGTPARSPRSPASCLIAMARDPS
jgi:hypothetical protein